MRVGIFLPNWIGDAVMATPALRALRGHVGPRSQLVGILRPYVADVVAGLPWLDEQVLYDPRSSEPSLRSRNLLRQLRSRRLDMAVLLTNSFRTALLARLSGARERIGFARGLRGPLLTRRLRHHRRRGKYIPSPVLDDYLELAYAVGCPLESPRMELATLAEDEQAADLTWRRLGLDRAEPVVALHNGGAYGSAKRWSNRRFALLARRLAADHQFRVLVLCGPADRRMAAEIVRLADHDRVVGLAEESLGIGQLKACLRRSRLLITTDSGPRHVAAAFDVPVITLFGPTHIAWSENHHKKAVHLQRQVPCGPCQRRECPLGHHRCMDELTVAEVYAAAAELLAPQTKDRVA